MLVVNAITRPVWVAKRTRSNEKNLLEKDKCLKR
jgi:hypothetical protein